MPAIETVILFMAASLALNVTPGPSILYVMSRSVGQGRTAGLVSALGLGAGSLIHAGAAALGLSVILAYSPLAYTVVKYLGAGYLVYLGVRILLVRDRQLPTAVLARVSLTRVFWQGVVTELLKDRAVFYVVPAAVCGPCPGIGRRTDPVLGVPVPRDRRSHQHAGGGCWWSDSELALAEPRV